MDDSFICPALSVNIWLNHFFIFKKMKTVANNS